jgi:hypothetical protein
MFTQTLTQHDVVLDALPFAEPAPSEPIEEAPPLPVNERSILGLAELLLKAPAARGEELLRELATTVETLSAAPGLEQSVHFIKKAE